MGVIALPGEDVLSRLVNCHDYGRAALLGQLHEDLHQQVGVVRVLVFGDTKRDTRQQTETPM